ncbi:MAG: PAS domain S-box protein [Bacteroidales bacterium]
MRMSRIMKNSQEIAHLGSFEFVAADQTTIWSEEEYRIYGLDPAGPSPTYEVMLEKCIHPEDRDLLHDTFMQAFQNKGVYELEHRITRPNGEVRWVVDKAHPYFDENGKLLRYVGATLDITERKLAEMELRRSEEKFRGLFQNHTAVKLIIDPDTGDIAEANQAAASFFGWPVEVLKSMNVRQINTSPVETLKEEISKAVHNGKSKFQFRHKKADGSVVDVEIFTSVISIEGKQYLHSIIQDISEKKKTENQLKLLNRAIEASSVAVIITNAEGEISYVNPFFSQMTGYGHNEIMGQKPSILKSGFLSATLYEELWSAISTGNTWEGELLNKKKNGDLFWVRILISPITNSKGELTNFVAIQEDISFKKQAAEIQNQLEVAQKSARFKQDFLAKMSHEIRTPLTGVLGMIEVLGQTPLAADQQEYIADIKTSGENLKEIINQVLEYSKIEAGKLRLRPQDFEFKTLFQETKQLYKDNLQAGVEFNIEIDPNIPSFIHADKFRLSQIVHNLVSNAIKFTHHGSVTLKAGLVPSTAADKPQVMKIEVSDTGKGIPESLQSLLFSPFVQSEEGEQNLYEGTGLGLSICKELVQLMNGEVGVVSKEEQGSTFGFTFAFEATPEVLVAEKKSCPLGESRSLHILVTEDTLVLQKVTKLLLMSMGHQVQLANHGQHALEMFEPGKFDLILMDVNMPIMDGVTATRLLKEQYANLPPIVGLSANAFEGDREKYITTGMDDYMIKPFNKEEFERVVARLLPLVKE